MFKFIEAIELKVEELLIEAELPFYHLDPIAHEFYEKAVEDKALVVEAVAKAEVEDVEDAIEAVAAVLADDYFLFPYAAAKADKDFLALAHAK